MLLLFIGEWPFSSKAGAEAGLAASDAFPSHFQPTWIIDPTNPGEDVPPVGRSLFDYLIAREDRETRGYHIPYPFSDLLKYMESTAGPEESSSRFKVVLIPFGRSLHRYAAQPDFLRFPRILATIDSDDSQTRSESRYPPLYLKNRLFLAYQEKAGIIEVISYNEAAGRFEFQIVRHYHGDTTPEVVYANRKVCTVCHQNHAPIFPEALWHETNAHPAIQDLLQSSSTQFASITHGVDIAAAFDAATDRANDILLAQTLWEEGCEYPDSPQQSIECRATLLVSALQQRLSGRSPFLNPSSSAPDARLFSLAQVWKTKWPNGIGIPNPNIPNRPLADVLTVIAPDVAHRYSSPTRDGPLHSHPLLDPITPRPPLAIWTFAPQDRLPFIEIITSLANMFSQADIQKLNDLLIKVAQTQQLPVTQHLSHCTNTIHAKTDKKFELKLECTPSSNSPRTRKHTFSLNGHVWFEQGYFQKGKLHRLQIGNEEEHDPLGIRKAFFQKEGAQGKWTLLIASSSSWLPARTHEGNFMEALVLHWPLPFPQVGLTSENPLTSDASLNILPDFSLVEKAVKMMAKETLAGKTDVLGSAPFQRMKVAQSLFHHLDPPEHIWCCEDPPELPPVVLDVHPLSGQIFAQTNAPPAPLQLLDRYCGDCHHGEDPAPPGFLHGSISQVETNLSQCAERMYVRLGNWQVPAADRELSPMPPPTALPRLTSMPGDWPQQEEFNLLKQYLQELILHKGGSPLSDKPVTLQEYAALPACLPPSTPHTSSPHGS